MEYEQISGIHDVCTLLYVPDYQRPSGRQDHHVPRVHLMGKRCCVLNSRKETKPSKKQEQRNTLAIQNKAVSLERFNVKQ